ncbi:hypothetical protein RT41_GL001422 [Lactococcus fujiensis JCM 16395]|uniref:DUF2142 domain-containing protein n=1 Tax=Lactococcus fujiensis JCM 16395 TaxID=1291764 RepID=A0A2A5RLH7_9LACT|nr:hypothetical protein RT41_GL001422 [Lactococcus fujiensis JCM 16395]
MLVIGFLAVFITPPLTMGDEGYHLSRSYNLFSTKAPESMSNPQVRAKEFEAIGLSTEGKINPTFYKKLITKKVDLQNDGVRFSVYSKWNNTFGPLDFMHLPAAIGVLIARLIYPSLGIMDYGGRIANLLFFAFAFYFLIKKNKYAKWSMILLFVIGGIQKIFSPSYDVLSFLVFAAFVVNLFDLAQLPTIREVSLKKAIYTAFLTCSFYFIKTNYVFAIFAFLGLPMFYRPIIKKLKSLKISGKFSLSALILGIIFIATYFVNKKIPIFTIIKKFIENYMNVEMMSNNAKQMWQIVPTTLPGFINIIFILILFIVMMGEFKVSWSKGTVIFFSMTYLVNWLGIFAGFFIENAALASANLQGRYLSPFMFLFVPFVQNLGRKFNFTMSDKAIKKLSVWTIITISILYLCITFYRSYILHVTPTWTNNA